MMVTKNVCSLSMECISSRNRLRDLGPSHPHQADQCLLLPTVADPGTKLAKSDPPHDCSYSLPFFCCDSTGNFLFPAERYLSLAIYMFLTSHCPPNRKHKDKHL